MVYFLRQIIGYIMEATIQTTDFKSIVKAILNRKAVVFVGQELTVNFGKPGKLTRKFTEIAAEGQQQYPISYHATDPFLNVESPVGLKYVRRKMEEFYETVEPNSVLEKLAQIPFHAYVCTSPDTALEKQFAAFNFPFVSEHFNAINLKLIKEDISAEKPLVYHIFGHLTDRDTYILSYSDVFRFLKALNSENLMPDDLKNMLGKRADHIIFLGMDFNQWQYPMLLNILEIDLAGCSNVSTSANKPEGYFETLHNVHFKITAVNTDVAEFVNELYIAFPPEKLRTKATAEQIKKKYNTDNILRFLKEAYNTTDFKTMCMLNFEAVYDDFTDEQSQTKRMTTLIDYCRRHEQFETLLQVGKDDNPVQFERFMPYFE